MLNMFYLAFTYVWYEDNAPTTEVGLRIAWGFCVFITLIYLEWYVADIQLNKHTIQNNLFPHTIIFGHSAKFSSILFLNINTHVYVTSVILLVSIDMTVCIFQSFFLGCACIWLPGSLTECPTAWFSTNQSPERLSKPLLSLHFNNPEIFPTISRG